MAPMTWIVVAIVTAIAVISIAATATGANRRGIRQFFADIRAGVETVPDADDAGRSPGPRPGSPDTSEVYEGSVADLFSLGEVPEHGYVDPGGLTETLARATRLSVRTVARLVGA